MSRTGFNLVAFVLALMLCGAGWHIVSKRRVEVEIADVDQRLSEELGKSRAENRELQGKAASLADASASLQKTKPSEAALTADPGLIRARVASELMNSGLLGSTPWPIPVRNSLEEGMRDVAEILGLSANETVALQETADLGKKEFTAALLKHAVVEREGTVVTITVKDEPDIRGAYARMMGSIATILGSERHGYYESLGAKTEIEKLFYRWGLGPTTLMVSHSTAIPEAFHASRTGSAPRSRGDPLGRLLYYYTVLKSGPSDGRVSGTTTIEYVGTNVGPLHLLIPPDL